VCVYIRRVLPAYLRRTGCSGGPAGCRGCRSPGWATGTPRWPRTSSWWDCTESHWLGCRSWSPHRLKPGSTCPSRPYTTRRQRNWGKNTPFYTLKRLSGEGKLHSQGKRHTNWIKMARSTWKPDARSELGSSARDGWILTGLKEARAVGRCALLGACSKTALLYRSWALFYEKPPKEPPSPRSLEHIVLIINLALSAWTIARRLGLIASAFLHDNNSSVYWAGTGGSGCPTSLSLIPCISN